MKRAILGLCLVAFFGSTAVADDVKKDENSAAAPSAVEKLKADPNDTAALNAYLQEQLASVSELMDTDPDKAERQLAEMTKVLNSLEPDAEEAKQLLTRAKSAVTYYSQRLEIARLSLADLSKKLEANPDDAKALADYVAKVTQEIGSTARSQPAKAEETLSAARKTLEAVKAKTTNDTTKAVVDRNLASLSRYDDTIAAGKKLAALVGADAAPLDVEAWVNGSPLTESDLKGKVVLLDFWAVWCGPCIATFPHLREWNEKYADKGLVMIGLTRYYNYTWNDETGRASRSSEKVTPEDEQKMLEHFAEQHNLHHRFAIQKDDKLSEYYAVGGIPHVVVIDREGKVRLIRVGSGEKNARDISELLEKLIAGG